MLNPRITNMVLRIGLYCGWLNLGVITIENTPRQAVVIKRKKEFLAKKVGLQANG